MSAVYGSPVHPFTRSPVCGCLTRVTPPPPVVNDQGRCPVSAGAGRTRVPNFLAALSGSFLKG